MPLFLCLETSTKNCSVCLAEDERVLAVVEESSDKYIHSEKLHLFIQQVFEQADRSMSQLAAVAVGKGPGSFTGLRIGISAAKGLCYALQVPVLSFDGLHILVNAFLRKCKVEEEDLIIPMLDARRMEIYCSVHDSAGNRLSAIEAKVIDEQSFSDLKARKIHLIGDGVEKLKEVLPEGKFVFHDLVYPSAGDMPPMTVAAYAKKSFEDVAYFEPFYLKDFVAGKPKKLL